TVYPELAATVTDNTVAHRNVLKQITEVSAVARPDLSPHIGGTQSVPDDLLAFVRLRRLASGDASIADVLALGSALVTFVPPDGAAAWDLLDEATDSMFLLDRL